MERICANCKHKKQETEQGFSVYKCRVRYKVNFITGDKKYESCMEYNYMGQCELYEQKTNILKRIICVLTKIEKK